MSIKDRFKLIMDREHLNAGDFAKNIRVAPSTISHIMSGRNQYPSMDVILKLHERYPEIKMEWLLTGEGDMCGSDVKDENSSPRLLFDEKAINESQSTVCHENYREMPLESTSGIQKEIVKQEIVYKERPPRHITEIRIFFDDNTYETFTPKTRNDFKTRE